MPPKKRQRASKKSAGAGNDVIAQQMKHFLKVYEQQCEEQRSAVDDQLKLHVKSYVTEAKLTPRFIMQGLPSASVPRIKVNDDPVQSSTLKAPTAEIAPVVPSQTKLSVAQTNESRPLRISPLIKTIRVCNYKIIKELYFWDLAISYADFASLATFLEQPVYNVDYLEILDCQVEAYSLERFSR